MIDKWLREEIFTPSEYRVERYFYKGMSVSDMVHSTMQMHFSVPLTFLGSYSAVDIGRLERLQETYKLLGDYYLSGSEDPDREKILLQLGRELMQILRKVSENLEEQNSLHDFRQVARQELEERLRELEEPILDTVSLLWRSEWESRPFFNHLEDLFDLIWTKLSLTKAEGDAVRNAMLEEPTGFVAQTLVGALFVGCMEYLDIEKMEVLLSLAEGTQHPRARGAAIVALLMLGRRHQEELELYYADFVRRVAELFVRRAMEEPENELILALKTIFTAYQTTHLHELYRERILPELQGLSERVRDLLGSDANIMERMQELGHEESEEMFEVSSLMENTQRDFQKIVREHADYSYHMVTELKRHPFFGRVIRWFLPYTPNHPSVDSSSAAYLERLKPVLFQGHEPCSSDMYSFALLNAWEMIGAQVEQQLDGMPLPEASPSYLSPVEHGMRDFTFGAYRFYTLASFASTMVSPFAKEPIVYDGPYTKGAFSFSEKELHELIDFLKHCRLYSHTEGLYKRLHAYFNDNSAELWRSLSAIGLLEEDDERALLLLHRAVNVEGVTRVTAEKVADLTAQIHGDLPALEWIERCEAALEPDEQLDLVWMKSQILYGLERYEEAEKSMHKLLYLQGDEVGEEEILLMAKIQLQLKKPKEVLRLVRDGALEEGDSLAPILILYGAVAMIAEGGEYKKGGVEILKKSAEKLSDEVAIEEALMFLKPNGVEEWEIQLLYDLTLLAPPKR